MAALDSIKKALTNPSGISPLIPLQATQVEALKNTMDYIWQSIPATEVNKSKEGVTVGTQYKPSVAPAQQQPNPSTATV